LTVLLLETQGLPQPAAALSFYPKEPRAMAFAIRNLSVLAYANGFTLWHYKAGKVRLNQVEKSDFFADAADMLAEGDMMMVSASDGGRILTIASGNEGQVATAPLV
jgi:hypothetical protein